METTVTQKGVMPGERLKSLRVLLKKNGFIRVMEAHNGLTALIVENVSVQCNGQERAFDAMWLSSLCDSTAKGKPDIELVDFTSRCRTLEDITEVTTKPIILDGDTGGKTEHLMYNVRTLERLGVSAIILEDKVGLKKNSLFGTDVVQEQDSIEGFSAKIAAARKARMTEDFMLISRIESLILKAGMEDALARAFAYVKAGTDAIMIHSKEKSPDEIFEFCSKFRPQCPDVPLVVVPSSFNVVYESELRAAGVNVVIYANHLIRSAYPAMMETARLILENERAKEADEKLCMSISKVLTLIPDTLYARRTHTTWS